ncbi:MAG: hypothetical protein EOP45_10815 [Sphingobacteriaceae bacterium]|nr:MAG: hypothetical protein EOP45_10815 [Sphingobacteriaceae bacterium]
MLADTQHSAVSGQFIAADIESNISVKTVIGFIELQFVAFSSVLSSDESITVKTSEDALVGKLCIFLNRKARAGGYPFFFHHQQMEDYKSGASAKPDIGTISYSEEIVIRDKYYSSDDSFFSIEAKRLPNPKAAKAKEYVIGSDKPCGGIERFKKGIHGRNLYSAAIIGFIQKEDFAYWIDKVNSWISELIISDNNLWKEEDKLIEVPTIQDLAKFSSHNYRIKNHDIDYIDLLHFWIKSVA